MNSTSNVYVWRKKTQNKKQNKKKKQNRKLRESFSIHIMLKIKKEEKENGLISTAVKAK